MLNYRVSKLTSTATATTTSVSVSEDSQPESSIERHQQGSFVGLSTTVHTPESRYISVAEPYAWLRLAAEISASQLQIDPFEELATYQTVSLYDDAQELSASFLSLPYEPLLSNEPSPVPDDANPIMEFEEPKPRSGQTLVDQDADSTDKWIIYSGDETKPFKCGYEGCGKTYTKKHSLRRHFPKHTGDFQFRCCTGGCTGKIKYCDEKTLIRHIYKKHTVERPYECDICNKRFLHPDTLLYHRTNVHSARDEQNQPQNSDSTDKWIMYSGDETRPFQCGYEGCGKTYITKQALQRHFPTHTGDSQLRCYTGDCTGATRYCDKQALARHIHKKHTMKRPFSCEFCNSQFVRADHLNQHQQSNICVLQKKRKPRKKSKNYHRNERENN